MNELDQTWHYLWLVTHRDLRTGARDIRTMIW